MANPPGLGVSGCDQATDNSERSPPRSSDRARTQLLPPLALPGVALAEGPSERSAAFETAFKELTGDTIPDTALITLELPEHAENGNIVPYMLSVESPMTEQDHVKSLHLLSTANPNAKVATFHFTPQSGVAKVTGRMRLAKTQDVICVAELSSGRKVMGTTRVEVALGGCLN